MIVEVDRDLRARFPFARLQLRVRTSSARRIVPVSRARSPSITRFLSITTETRPEVAFHLFRVPRNPGLSDEIPSGFPAAALRIWISGSDGGRGCLCDRGRRLLVSRL
jgi:hypothetical protein